MYLFLGVQLLVDQDIFCQIRDRWGQEGWHQGEEAAGFAEAVWCFSSLSLVRLEMNTVFIVLYFAVGLPLGFGGLARWEDRNSSF